MRPRGSLLLLGFLVDAVASLMSRERAGRSAVVASGHVLILGYTDKCLALICELALGTVAGCCACLCCCAGWCGRRRMRRRRKTVEEREQEIELMASDADDAVDL